MRIKRTLLATAIAGLALAGTMSCGINNANAAPTKTNNIAQDKWVFGPSKTI